MRKIFLLAIFIAQFSLLLPRLTAQVASESEMLAPSKVGREDMIEVFASDIIEGDYEIEVESSSSMFRIVKCALHVKDGNMNARLTMSGKGYTKLFLGKAEDASNAGGTGEILPLEGEENSTFDVPVSVLNSPIKCAAFSTRKKKWYDRDILFNAGSLPKQALLIYPFRQQEVNLKNGNYLVSVTLSGGSGKAKITSPAIITVKDRKAQAKIEWSSRNYDYMKVNGERFEADDKILDKGGNSTFVIPVYAFDTEVPVLADTNAMSQSHEILYQLKFELKSAKKTRKK